MLMYLRGECLTWKLILFDASAMLNHLTKSHAAQRSHTFTCSGVSLRAYPRAKALKQTAIREVPSGQVPCGQLESLHACACCLCVMKTLSQGHRHGPSQMSTFFPISDFSGCSLLLLDAGVPIPSDKLRSNSLSSHSG